MSSEVAELEVMVALVSLLPSNRLASSERLTPLATDTDEWTQALVEVLVKRSSAILSVEVLAEFVRVKVSLNLLKDFPRLLRVLCE